MAQEDNSIKLDVPQGIANAWIFVQKRIIFEAKITLMMSMNKYHRIYVRKKENDALLQEAVIQMRILWLEIKEIVRRNKKAKANCKSTIDYMDLITKHVSLEFTSEDFPLLYFHFVNLLDMLVYIGLTDIECKNDDPHTAIMNGSQS